MHLSNVLKRSTCAVVSTALLSSSLLLSGCSTPKVAAKVDNVEYSSADYLAYLYNAYEETFYYNSLSQYSQYGMDPWTQKLTYGEGDSAEQVSVEEYIKRLAKDTMIRQVAIKKMMDQYGITYSDSDLSTFNQSVSSLTADEFIKMGFNNDTYKKMYQAVSLNESTLFYGLYDNNGSRAMSDDEINQYYKDNILTYKMIEVSLTDSSGADLSDDQVNDKKATLQKYMDIYKASGNFDSAITQYNADQQAAAATTTTGTATDTTSADGTDATTTAVAATTTAAATTTTTAASTTTSGSSATTTTASGSSDSTSGTSTDSNLKYADANTYGDEDFTNAVKSVPIGKAQIVTYKKSGTTNTIALIYRIDPETTQYKLSEARKNVIYGAKYKDFDTEVKSSADALTSDFSSSFIKKTSPKDEVANAPTSSES